MKLIKIWFSSLSVFLMLIAFGILGIETYNLEGLLVVLIGFITIASLLHFLIMYKCLINMRNGYTEQITVMTWNKD
jgi:hypothetical protein